MLSRCCGSEIFPASALSFVQLCSDYYICSRCSLPCDMVFPRDTKDSENEQF